ncbi:MAG: hypothetical protein R2873_27295, partial [Caldilineaceae bacterium]
MITAVAWPNFDSEDVDIPSAVFTFLLPADTEIDPSISPLPAIGSLTNVTGEWSVARLTASAYVGAGGAPADL